MRLSSVAADGDDIYWIEGRPTEGGRDVLVRRSADGRIADVVPPGFNVRTRVHEYGGGAYVVDAGLVCCSSFADGRVYRVPGGGDEPEPLTPSGPWRYADPVIDRRRRRVIAVREDHTDPAREPVNTIVAISLESDAGSTARPDAVQVLTSGFDFYSTPRVSPDGTRLSWLCWNHPRMPWDGSEVWTAEVGADGALRDPQRVAGGPRESIYQPGWSPDGSLYFVSDRSGWWQLYRVDRFGLGSSETVPVLREAPPDAEFGRPEWTFGTTTWAFAGAGRIVVSYTMRGRWRLAVIDVESRTLRDLPTPFEPQAWLAASDTHAIAVAGSAREPDAVVAIDLASGRADVLRAVPAGGLDPSFVSVAEAISFPSAHGRIAHAFYYAPRHGSIAGPPGEAPPLIAMSHGGPTAAARATLDLRIQFWTTRGFAVIDVNYGGSSGYGRAYREQLNGTWGIVDVEDMIAAVRSLVAEGKADPHRSAIRGGSAGGFTTLAALTFHPGIFRAGASYYGVSDLEALARDTHKFEARYLDTLVGPYPAMRDEYRRRSPIHALDRLSCALILFQGLEDRVVPPDQSEMMADAVRRKGLPVAYLAFEGEQHGFRRAETNERCLESELAFYGAIFGFVPAGPIPPLAIDNLR